MGDKKRAILINVLLPGQEEDFGELSLLAETAGIIAVAERTQHRRTADKAYYVGKGKLKELKVAVDTLSADIVIFDNDLNSTQFRNLEKELEVEVIDRATLILEIFALNADTAEGKLQVELARKKHDLPRRLAAVTAYTRQGGGGAGGEGARRGGGEQKNELIRREIRGEVRNLEAKIARLTEERRLRRKKREIKKIKTVSIVGYTNSGKSTLMNVLTKAGVPEEDKLFATLDVTERRLWLAPGKEFVLSDTVGFISRLPHEFVEAFKSTLEETKYADLILHVVNLRSGNVKKEYDVVGDTLKSIGAGNIPVLVLLNKIDAEDADNAFAPPANFLKISAKYGYGIDVLRKEIADILFGK